MNHFRQLFEEKLNEFMDEPNMNESPLVKFISQLKKQKIVNKFIKIPQINSEFDGDFLFVEYNGKLYSWFITDNKTKDEYIEKSNDQFSKYEKCLENLIDILKER